MHREKKTTTKNPILIGIMIAAAPGGRRREKSPAEWDRTKHMTSKLFPLHLHCSPVFWSVCNFKLSGRQGWRWCVFSLFAYLKIPKRNIKSLDDRSFIFIAPTVWNSLPASLRNLPTLSDFKAQLKTFLFFNRHFYKSRWTMVCASALSSLDGKICAIQEPSIVFIIIAQRKNKKKQKTTKT